MARPKLKIDPKLVQDLAALGCKNTEIAVVVGCTPETLENRFSSEMAKGRENLKISLRRWQLEAAKKGNVAMLIWLGKQMLGQTEKVEQVVDAKVSAKNEITYTAQWGGVKEPSAPGNESES